MLVYGLHIYLFVCNILLLVSFLKAKIDIPLGLEMGSW